MPAWPLFKQNGTAMELVGYAFESADLAPIPGFAGVPFNLLVAIDPKGTFIGVEVISQHEPVFLDGLGEAPLHQFVQQYKGLSLAQAIDVGGTRAAGGDANRVHLDGVSKATASVRILNQSVLAAALRVARTRLGFAAGRDPSRLARIRDGQFRQMSWGELQDAGLLRHVRVLNSDVERLFAGSDGAGLDPAAAAHPDDVFIDLYLAWRNKRAAWPTNSCNAITLNFVRGPEWTQPSGLSAAGLFIYKFFCRCLCPLGACAWSTGYRAGANAARRARPAAIAAVIRRSTGSAECITTSASNAWSA